MGHDDRVARVHERHDGGRGGRAEPPGAIDTLLAALLEDDRDAVHAWQHERDAHQVTVDWQFITEHARIKLKRLYPSLHE